MSVASRSRTERNAYKTGPLFHEEIIADQATSAGDSSDEHLSGYNSGDTWDDIQDNFSTQMRRGQQYYPKVIETSVSAFDPTDFATAWNAAANVSGWKREEPDYHPKGRKVFAQKTNKKTGAHKNTGDGRSRFNAPQRNVQAKEHRTENMPLPKFLTMAPMPTGLVNIPMQPDAFQESMSPQFIGVDQAWYADFAKVATRPITPPPGLSLPEDKEYEWSL